jgi:ATP-dependent RNA helicase DHX29
LLCGDVRVDMYAGVMVLDGNRARFALPDWKTVLVVKVLRARLREMLTRAFKNPGKLPTPQHTRWLEVWQKLFAGFQEVKEKVRERDGVKS